MQKLLPPNPEIPSFFWPKEPTVLCAVPLVWPGEVTLSHESFVQIWVLLVEAVANSGVIVCCDTYNITQR